MCHGILGEELFDLQEEDQLSYGWDMMIRTARILNLSCPFQVVIYAQATSKIQRPLHPVQIDPERSDTTFCYIVQKLKAPTAAVSHDLLAAISKKDLDKVTQLLGGGLDLRGPDTAARPISTLMAAAILADHSLGPYSDPMTHGPVFAHGTILTYLLLQSLANPNVIPRLERPTTMLELAVELGNSHIVQSLLEARASVVPIQEALPPLLLAVLHRHQTNVQLLLQAHANPWETVPIGHLHRYTMQWHAHAARNEAFTIVQAAAAQDPCDTVLELLLQGVPYLSEKESRPPEVASTIATALSERATTILRQLVWIFQHVIVKQERKPDFTTFRWRVILQGIPLPAHTRMHTGAMHQDYDDGIPWDLLSEVDYLVRPAVIP